MKASDVVSSLRSSKYQLISEVGVLRDRHDKARWHEVLLDRVNELLNLLIRVSF